LKTDSILKWKATRIPGVSVNVVQQIKTVKHMESRNINHVRA